MLVGTRIALYVKLDIANLMMEFIMAEMLPLLFQKRHVLPSGRMQIYISTVDQVPTLKTALTSKSGLGICMYSDKKEAQHLFHIGTRVTIDDFDQDPNTRLLKLTVSGQNNFKIQSIEQTTDGVFWGKTTPLPRWKAITINNEQRLLATRLKKMFEKFPDLDELYKRKDFDNLSWLCQRWLEILPLPAVDKQKLLNKPTCLNTYDYLMSMIKTSH